MPNLFMKYCLHALRRQSPFSRLEAHSWDIMLKCLNVKYLCCGHLNLLFNSGPKLVNPSDGYPHIPGGYPFNIL